jgi:hypothetical protein
MAKPNAIRDKGMIVVIADFDAVEIESCIPSGIGNDIYACA